MAIPDQTRGPSLPNRIRELREQRGLSLQFVGDAIGVSKVQVARLELGERPLNLEYLRAIARVLSVSVIDLLPASMGGDVLDAYERDLIERLRASEPRVREAVSRVADSLSRPT